MGRHPSTICRELERAASFGSYQAEHGCFNCMLKVSYKRGIL
ncbi:hypothetical protein EDO6_02341 [Paenibacillus xylanexedens]|nr:hypothetical protein EDO6_02341 [Paenibacillus xylanexedens]